MFSWRSFKFWFCDTFGHNNVEVRLGPNATYVSAFGPSVTSGNHAIDAALCRRCKHVAIKVLNDKE